MNASGGGSIINMSSISWMIPSTGLPVYVTAKAAIVGLTRTLAHELGTSNIRVNCVSPRCCSDGEAATTLVEPRIRSRDYGPQALKRSVTPEDVARLVLFLASDDSSAITSQSYHDRCWLCLICD